MGTIKRAVAIAASTLVCQLLGFPNVLLLEPFQVRTPAWSEAQGSTASPSKSVWMRVFMTSLVSKGVSIRYHPI